MRSGRKSFPIQALLFLLLAGTAGGQGVQSDAEIRERWAGAVAATRTEVCAGESEPIRKSIDYAAMLIVHGEIEEAREVLKRAADKASTAACREALLRLTTAPR